jgi:hypothetical protein
MTFETVQQISILTRWFIIAILCIGAAWDVYVESQWGSQATISYQIQSAAFKYPIIPMAFGVLAGHFFWQTYGIKS